MILQDSITGLNYEILVDDGQITITASSDTNVSTAVVRDEVTSTIWDIAIADEQLILTETTKSVVHSWIRDSATPTTVWEFHVTDGQLYILEISTAGIGRIVFVQSGLITNTISLTCLIAQELITI